MGATMKGFMFGIAAIAIALFFAFEGGVLIADWLNKDALPKQTRLEKIKQTDGRAASGPEIGKKEEPKRNDAKNPASEENALLSKKVGTKTVTSPLPGQTLPSALPLTSTPMGLPQPLVRVEPQASRHPLPQTRPPSQSRDMSHERVPTGAKRQEVAPGEVSRSRAIEQQVVRPEPQRRQIARERKKAANQERPRAPRERAEATDSAPREEMAFEDDARPSRTKRSETGRRIPDTARDDGDGDIVAQQRPVAPLRPLFGLFGL